MGLLIRNGTVVSRAIETLAADILIEGEAHQRGAPRTFRSSRGHEVIDATGMLLIARRHRRAHASRHALRRHHLERRFRNRHARGGIRRHHHPDRFRHPGARHASMRDALDIWWKKAESSASIDYGLHMIVTDLGEAGLEDMDDMVREGVASFKLFMAYPGRADGGRRDHFQGALRSTAQERRADLHARRKRQRDRRDRAARAGRGQDRAHLSRAHAAGHAPRPKPCIAPSPWRKLPARPVYIVHLSSEDALNQVREARDRGVPVFAETCPQYLLLSIDELARPGFRRREIRLHAAAAREAESAETVGWPEARSSAGGLHRPLPVLFRRSENSGQRRFHQDSQRRPGHRESPAASLSSRRERRQALR